MAIKLSERSYFTFPELMARWQCEEKDFFHLFLENKLVPSYFFSGDIKCHDHAAELEHRSDDIFDETPMVSKVFMAHEFMFLLWPHQTSVHDLSFHIFASTRNGEPLSYAPLIYPPMALVNVVYSFQDVIKNGAVMMSEVALFEESAGRSDAQPVNDKLLTTTERNTLLKLVIGMAVKGYNYDPRATKSTTPKEVVDDLAGLGITITDDTVRKYLKQAADALLPAKPHQS